MQPLSLLVYSQVVLCMMIPLPMVPLLYYTSRKKFMGEFVNRWATTIIALVFASTIIVLDAYLLMTL